MRTARIGTANWQIGRLVDLEREDDEVEDDDDGQSQFGLRIPVGLVRATSCGTGSGDDGKIPMMTGRMGWDETVENNEVGKKYSGAE